MARTTAGDACCAQTPRTALRSMICSSVKLRSIPASSCDDSVAAQRGDLLGAQTGGAEQGVGIGRAVVPYPVWPARATGAGEYGSQLPDAPVPGMLDVDQHLPAGELWIVGQS